MTRDRRGQLSRRAVRRARRLVAVAAMLLTVLCGSAAPAFAGNDTVDNYVICVWWNTDGSMTSVWGYNNHTGDTVTVPVGGDNRITSAPYDRGQPTVFLPGKHDNAWVHTDMGSSIAWHLLTNGDTANNGSPLCPSNPVPVVGGWYSGALALLAAALGALVIVRTPRLRALFRVPTVARRGGA